MNEYGTLFIPNDASYIRCDYLGTLDTLARPLLFVTGSRRTSAEGITLANRVCDIATDAGIAVVSTLSQGIGAAVAKRVTDNGGDLIAITATPLGTSPYKPSAPYLRRAKFVISADTDNLFAKASIDARNQLLRFLAPPTIVIKATPLSSMVTFARDISHASVPVAAFPGSVLDYSSAGPNSLIQSGDAEPLLSDTDVIDFIDNILDSTQEHAFITYRKTYFV